MMQKKTFWMLCIFLSFLTVALGSGCGRLNGPTWRRFYPSPDASSKFIHSIRPYRGDAASHYSLACYLQKRKKHAMALEEFKTAVDIDPEYVKALNGIGISYDALGDHAKAIESYEAALQVNPDLGYVLNNLGYAYFLQGKLDRAIETYQKAIAVDGRKTRYHNNLAFAYAKKGEQGRAFNEFKIAGGETKAHLNKEPGGSYETLEIDGPAPSGSRPVPRRSMIEVSNGNGVRRMARKVGHYLNANGFKLMYLTNADSFNHTETVIYYRRGYIEEARMAAQKLPGYQKMQEISDLEPESAEIRVLIGQDLIRHISLFQKS